MASAGGIQIPSRLPLLLTHEGVLLPGSTVRFSVDSPRNMQLVSQRLLKGTSLKSTIIGVIPNTRDPEQDSDQLPPLHQWASFLQSFSTFWCSLVIAPDGQRLEEEQRRFFCAGFIETSCVAMNWYSWDSSAGGGQ
ncbi:hypothetical protein ATANTOWER_020787 [Ataeniobius toweri]|uniref:Lon N-terminal domain-containing protein n=1 Tax=Ataeniobius toweri TaxID=208326 RepID=A0ABU7BJR3_9TELE|nr:hypothetical protein [Ataeniobius toweri]